MPIVCFDRNFHNKAIQHFRFSYNVKCLLIFCFTNSEKLLSPWLDGDLGAENTSCFLKLYSVPFQSYVKTSFLRLVHRQMPKLMLFCGGIVHVIFLQNN